MAVEANREIFGSMEKGMNASFVLVAPLLMAVLLGIDRRIQQAAYLDRNPLAEAYIGLKYELLYNSLQEKQQKESRAH